MCSTAHFGSRPFAMKLHHANRRHFDLRLELNGVLLSWAISADLSLCAGMEFEAVEMEDHRLANILFEGEHKTGTIMLWDRGAWEPLAGFEDVRVCLGNGLLRFVLFGERLGGVWTLLKTNRTKGTRPVWTLRREADTFSIESTEHTVLAQWPNSVQTKRAMDEIREDWSAPKRKRDKHPNLFDQDVKM